MVVEGGEGGEFWVWLVRHFWESTGWGLRRFGKSTTEFCTRTKALSGYGLCLFGGSRLSNIEDVMTWMASNMRNRYQYFLLDVVRAKDTHWSLKPCNQYIKNIGQ